VEQVPSKSDNPNYLIIGNGKLARHLCHYFDLENIQFSKWDRSSNTNLAENILKSDIILILITDDSIENFYLENLLSYGKECIHFSGALTIDGVKGLHPLNMFGQELMKLDEYRKQIFVCEEGMDFKNTFPKLKNQFYSIPVEKKAYYHALCVMAGNFTTFLWDKVQNSFESDLGLPAEVLTEYMKTVMVNLQKEKPSFTGPLVRRDLKTIKKNIASLEGDEYQAIYKSFAKLKGIELKDINAEDTK
jgi:hypothetical protein